MSMLSRSTFRDDGYADGKAGKKPSPPDVYDGSAVLSMEYMDGYAAACCERAGIKHPSAIPALVSALQGLVSHTEEEMSLVDKLEHMVGGHDPEGCVLCSAQNALEDAGLECR